MVGRQTQFQKQVALLAQMGVLVSYIWIPYALAMRLLLHEFNQWLLTWYQLSMELMRVSTSTSLTTILVMLLTTVLVLLPTIAALSTTTALAIAPQSTSPPMQQDTNPNNTLNGQGQHTPMNKKTVNALFWRGWNEWNICLHNKANVFQHNWSKMQMTSPKHQKDTIGGVGTRYR